MVSPGRSRQGSGRVASKNTISVLPMVFQPLGPSDAETPAEHRHLAARGGDAAVHAAEVAIAGVAADGEDGVVGRGVDGDHLVQAQPGMRDDVGDMRSGVAAIGDLELDRATGEGQLLRVPSTAGSSGRADKVTMRLFMPGTASATSGQDCASLASAQMRCWVGSEVSPGASNSKAVVPRRLSRA
eukprot:gene4261-4309_t